MPAVYTCGWDPNSDRNPGLTIDNRGIGNMYVYMYVMYCLMYYVMSLAPCNPSCAHYLVEGALDSGTVLTYNALHMHFITLLIETHLQMK